MKKFIWMMAIICVIALLATTLVACNLFKNGTQNSGKNSATQQGGTQNSGKNSATQQGGGKEPVDYSKRADFEEALEKVEAAVDSFRLEVYQPKQSKIKDVKDYIANVFAKEKDVSVFTRDDDLPAEFDSGDFSGMKNSELVVYINEYEDSTGDYIEGLYVYSNAYIATIYCDIEEGKMEVEGPYTVEEIRESARKDVVTTPAYSVKTELLAFYSAVYNPFGSTVKEIYDSIALLFSYESSIDVACVQEDKAVKAAEGKLKVLVVAESEDALANTIGKIYVCSDAYYVTIACDWQAGTFTVSDAASIQ